MSRERSRGQPGTITLEQPRQDLWRRLAAGEAVKTGCDESVAQRCGEPARLAPVQKHERERGVFLRLHHEIPGMRIGVENGFGKSGNSGSRTIRERIPGRGRRQPLCRPRRRFR
jgi:hypothetical protein